MDIDKIVAESRASQNKVELKKTLKYVSEINPTRILEIGMHQGYSMEVWRKAFPGATIVGIDNDFLSIKYEITLNDYLIEGDSHKEETKNRVTEIFGKDQIDFLFIDGDHTYEGVKKDYELYSPLVRKGGIIVFHDVALDSNTWRENGVDVARFWNELISEVGIKYLFFWDEIGKGTGIGLYYKK